MILIIILHWQAWWINDDDGGGDDDYYNISELLINFCMSSLIHYNQLYQKT